MRVMHVTLGLDPGGAERLVVDLVRAMSGHGTALVACLDHLGVWGDELSREGITVHLLGRRPGFRPGLARRLWRLARDERADVLHCHQYTPFVYGALASLGPGGSRVVFTEHGRLSDAPPSPRRRLANTLLGLTPGVAFCAVSADVKQFMQDEGLPGDRIEVIQNGITPGPSPSVELREHARRELGVPPDVLAIGTAARLDPVKDLRTLLHAFRAVADQRNATLLVLGDGHEREALITLRHDLGLDERVRFLGFREDVRTLLAGLDLYVNSSISEGISLTILEAMAVGVPVVATAVGGTPEVLSHGGGILVPSRDQTALAEAVLALIDSAELRARLGDQGRERVCTAFSSDRMTARYRDLYRALVSRGR